MKRKLFSAILFGALLTASTSGLTSCKDYDDDISNLQGQIDKLATADQLSAKVSELQTAIAAAQSAAEAKAAAAETVAKAAQSAADAAATAASKAQSTADAATKDAAAAAAAAAEVQKAADKAIADLEAKAATKEELDAAKKLAADAVAQIIADHATDKAAIEKAIADSKTELLAEIKKNSDAIAALKTRLDKVEAKLGMGEGGEDIDLTEIQKEIEAIEKDLEALGGAVSTMVTSINLYFNTSNNCYPNAYISPYDDNLYFAEVEEQDNVFPKNGETGDDKFTFVAGEVKTLEDSVIVRVNPVNAVLTKANVSLMNSQGKELNDLIEVTSVERYSTENAPLTRAAGNENGLWVIKFKPFDNYDADAFEEAAVYENHKIVYAVAVKNSDENLDADRRVISEYGLTIATGPVSYADLFEVSQGDVTSSVADIHNRYLMCEDGHRTDAIEELDWADTSDENPTPATEATKDNSIDRKGWLGDSDNPYTYNWRDTGDDNRQNRPVYVAKVGEQIKITFPATDTDKKFIKGFYVTLDYKRALESKPSELNAWNSYTYENVTTYDKEGKILKTGKLQPGNSGYITVKDMGDVKGDVIGFRVFAVNLDGTLVDPDGKAFYVGLGNYSNDVALEDKTITITYDAYKAGNGYLSDVIGIDDAFDCEFDYVWVTATGRDNTNIETCFEELDGYSYSPSGCGYDLIFVDKDGNETANKSKVAGIKVKIVDPTKVENDYPVAFNVQLRERIGNTYYTKRNVTFKVTKKMPNEVPSFSYITQQTKKQIMVPVASATDTDPYAVETKTVNGKTVVDPKDGYKALNNVYIFDANSVRFKDDPNFSYEISACDRDADAVVAQNITTPYELTVEGEFVDNKTDHSVKSTYIYRNISLVWDAENNRYEDDHDWKASKDSEKPLVFMSWANYNTYRWAKKGENGNDADYKPSVEWKPDGTGILTIDLKNWIVVNSADAATFNKANLAGYLEANWLKVLDSAKDIRTYVGSQDNPYFTATLNATQSGTTITLNQSGSTQSQAAPEAKKHEENLEIKVVDCFGISYTYTLPFDVTRQ